MQHFKHHAELYGKAFIVLDSRGGDLEDFFRLKSSPYCIDIWRVPQLLYQVRFVGIHNGSHFKPVRVALWGASCTRCLWLHCYWQWSTHTFTSWYSCPREDLRFLFWQGILPKSSSWLETIYKSRHRLGPVSCTDIKGGTREKRGTGTRPRVSGTAKIPGDWQKYLANVDNKKELFSFLSRKLLTDGQFPDDKDVYITAGDQVHHVGNSPPMDQCNHEEADTRVLVHLHALQTSSLGMVHTGDTDVVVLSCPSE